jgi:hypothetical protein
LPPAGGVHKFFYNGVRCGIMNSTTWNLRGNLDGIRKN